MVKNLLVKGISAFFILVNIATLVNAAMDVDIDADYSYNDKEREVIIAKGHVKARASDFYLESPYVKYYYKQNKIVAEDQFFIDLEGYRISGSKLEYKFDDNTGVAGIVRINFGNTFMGGSYMTFDKDNLEIYNAYYTGCNKKDSDYHISANELVLYPQTGLIVAYWATAWIGAAPVIPVPTFVYSAQVPPSKFRKKTEKKMTAKEKWLQKLETKKHAQPVPQFATNPDDGWFIRQGFNWFFGPKWYAKMMISYMEKKNMGIGLKTNYIFNDHNEGEIRLAQTAGDGGYGGISHFTYFGGKIMPKEDEDWLIYDTYKQGDKYAYELQVDYSNRERIHYDENTGPFNRVSFVPKVAIRSNRQPLPGIGDPYSYFMEVNGAKVSEEASGIETSRKQFFGDISLDQDWDFWGKFKAMIDYNTISYDTGFSWQRATQKVELSEKYFDMLDVNIGHVHYLHQARSGTSFVYEQYEVAPGDQFLGGVKARFWWSSLSIDTVHNLPKWDPFSIKYELVIGMHCYDLKFGYKVLFGPPSETEFLFTVDLSQSRWLEK